MDLTSLTIDAARSAVQGRKTTALALAEAHYTRIQKEDGQIGAFLTLAKERALEQADRIDRMAAEGKPLPPLGGVPVGIKDVLSTRGVRTTAGSKILEKYVPPYDCTAVARMEAAGAVMLGKMNCDEFAMGSSNENSAYHPVRNPRDLNRVPGGSSGGSAAAVAADMAVVALGSDTGGSIRQPASFCGVVGLMPTYGRVSRYGLIAFASSLDHIGPLAKTVKDAAIVLRAIAGRDPMDSTSADVPVPDYVAELDKPVRGLKLGVAREYFAEGLDDEVRQAVESAIEETRRAISEGNVERVNAAAEQLTKASHRIAETLYKTQAAAGGAGTAGTPGSSHAGSTDGAGKQSDVVDAEFVDVDESKKPN